MGEFAHLLKEAAGQPPRPLSMAAVRERATRLGMRRRAGVWLWAVLAALGIGVPAGVSLVPSGDRPTDVRTIENDRDPQPPPSGPDGTADPELGGTSRENQPTGSATGFPRASAPPRTEPATGALPLPTTTTTSPTGRPAEAHCSVDTSGLSRGEVRTCTFSATTAGGWRADLERGCCVGFNDFPEATVTVTRDGISKTYFSSVNEDTWIAPRMASSDAQTTSSNRETSSR